jgi:hypothetical protein
MRCNTSLPTGKRKANRLALIRNKKKIEHVGRLGMLYDKLEAEYNSLPEDSPLRDEKKAKMDEVKSEIITMSAQINDEVYKTSRSKTDVPSAASSDEEQNQSDIDITNS